MAPQRLLADRQSPGDWAWLADGILGRKAVRPAEAPRQVELRPGTVPAAKSATKAEGC
jgi:hypothetical protein